MNHVDMCIKCSQCWGKGDRMNHSQMWGEGRWGQTTSVWEVTVFNVLGGRKMGMDCEVNTQGREMGTYHIDMEMEWSQCWGKKEKNGP